jgi:hypothetical protein
VRWAAPLCLALVVGMLIGVTLAKPEKRFEPFGAVQVLEWKFWPDVR